MVSLSVPYVSVKRKQPPWGLPNPTLTLCRRLKISSSTMAKMTNEEMVSISIIERWNLTQYDTKDSGGDVIRWYRVRKSWADAMWGKLKRGIGWLSLDFCRRV